jgi:protein-L-isoaspartate O-methyltransferase
MSQSATAPAAYPLAGTATVDGPRHHGYLSELLDPVTRSRIADLGDLTGKQVLEVGAGAGSVAVWLADQVGPTGSVLAVDLDTTWLPQHPQLRGLEYDVTKPQLPEGSWDLIHSRLVLNHLGSRREVTHRLVEALNPGGHIVLEDWHGMDTETAMWAPSQREFDLINKVQEALGANFTASGTNREWCRSAPAALTDDHRGVLRRRFGGHRDDQGQYPAGRAQAGRLRRLGKRDRRNPGAARQPQGDRAWSPDVHHDGP